MRAMRAMSWIELLGIVGSVITIIGFLFSGIATINNWIDSLRPPTTFTFYFLAFWALVAAALGGLVWNFLNRTTPGIGGPVEPQGWKAMLWAITTNLPIVLTLLILNLWYHFTSIPYQLLLYGAFLIGVMIGSLIFYGGFSYWRNKTFRGFRRYLTSNNWSYFPKELLLVILWSLLISGLGFLAMGLMKWKVAGVSDFLTPIAQIGFCVALTMLAVVFFLLVFPAEPRFDSARGIIAGLALRMTLFFGVLLGTGPVNFHL